MAANGQPQLEDVAWSTLIAGSGQSYASFRSSLSPAWLVVARDLALGYLMLAIVAVLLFTGVTYAEPLRFLWVGLGALSFGYWMAYVQLFLHEAAHFNLCRGRRVNDLLANALVGVWVGADIRDYRRIHWDHHRFLGQPSDTERSYFSPLGWRFILETLFFVAPLRVILNRRRALARGRGTAPAHAAAGRGMLLAGALLHAGVLALCVWQGQWELAAAWFIGSLMVYPLFGALRQLLEHRGPTASAAIDYSIHPHGKFTRSFKGGPFGSFLGGAGFRWHDVHHLDPELSYTNLAAADAFLQHCAAARLARVERKSYASIMFELWQR